MSVHFPSNQFLNKMDRFAEKGCAYSMFGFMGTVAFGGAVATAAIASRGRWHPPAYLFRTWEKTMHFTATTMIFSGVTAVATDTVMKSRNKPF